MQYAGQRQVELLVEAQVQEQTEAGRDALAEDRCIGGARDAELRASEKSEDHDRIEDDVQDGAGQLGTHGQYRLASRLQLAFEGQLEEKPDREHADNAEIGVSGLYDFRHGGLTRDKRAGHEDACQKKDDKVQRAEKETGIRRIICTVEVFLAE